MEGPSGTGPSTRAPTPAQLPPDVAEFTGREPAIAELIRVVGDESPAVPVAVVAGMGGVGKTALALHVAHRVRDRFPDGQLYVELGGAGPRPARPPDVLARLLRSLGVDEALPDALEERAALYRTVLAGRRVLVLLDNAADATQIRPLVPGVAGCAVLATGRSRLAGLEGAHVVPLDVLEPTEALELLSRVAGAERVAGERPVAIDVVAACGFLPLAVRIVGARLAGRPARTVAGLSAELADERRRLGRLRVGGLAAETPFAAGYDRLGAAERRAFRLLAVPDTPDLSLGAAAATLGLSPDRAEPIAESLVDLSLLESPAPGRYRFHELMRLFARAKAATTDPPAALAAALGRLLDFYLASARNALRRQAPGDGTVDLLARTRSAGAALPTARAARAWLLTEYPGVFAVIEQAAGDTGGPMHTAADVLLAMGEFIDCGWNSAEPERVARGLTEGARDRGARGPQARAAYVLGRLLQWRRRFGDAEARLLGALRLSIDEGDHVLHAFVIEALSLVAVDRNRPDEAVALSEDSLDAWRRLGHADGQARAWINRARAHLCAGDPVAAVAGCRRGLAMHRADGNVHGESHALHQLGIALRAIGRTEEALAGHAQSLICARAVGVPLREASIRLEMAATYLAHGSPRRAVAHAERARAYFRECGCEHDVARALAVLGRAFHIIGRRGSAVARLAEAYEIFTREGAPESGEVAEHLRRIVAGPDPEGFAAD